LRVFRAVTSCFESVRRRRGRTGIARLQGLTAVRAWRAAVA
jgi:hypothetical protein